MKKNMEQSNELKAKYQQMYFTWRLQMKLNEALSEATFVKNFPNELFFTLQRVSHDATTLALGAENDFNESIKDLQA